MSLKIYKKKRDFTKTKEPQDSIRKVESKKKIFVIHFHKVSHDHYDLRLEMNHVLKSWALPKSPPTKKGIKRLAIQVEDHALSYAKFEGEIVEGYGKGKVKIWDNGNYDLIEKDSKKIVFELHGKKLKGKYCLVKIGYGNKPEKSWLFFKI